MDSMDAMLHDFRDGVAAFGVVSRVLFVVGLAMLMLGVLKGISAPLTLTGFIGMLMSFIAEHRIEKHESRFMNPGK